MTTTRAMGILVVAAALGGASASVESVARAAGPDDREQCANSAEQAQQLRDEGKYRRAREQMLVCARDACPGPIKSDCGKWLTELDQVAPTVVFGARDVKGSDVFDVKVSMDGVPIQERLDGKPVLVDSGEHTFHFEAKDGSTKDEKVLLRAAEKARPIIVTIGKDAGPVALGTTGGGSTADRSDGSLVPIAVVGGIGVLALGSFAVFGISGKSDVDDLQKCKPRCLEDDVDSARTKLIVADISLGIGIVALGVATYMFFTRPRGADAKVTSGKSTVKLDARPLAGGAYAGLGGQF